MNLLMIMYAASTVFLYFFFRSMFKVVLLIPFSSSYDIAEIIGGIDKKNKGIMDYAASILTFILDKFTGLAKRYDFIFTGYETEKLAHDLKRVGITESPERFRARQITYPGIIVSIGLLLYAGLSAIGANPAYHAFSMIAYIFLATSIVLGIIFISEPQVVLKTRLEQHNAKIIEEIPRFISTFKFTPDNVDFLIIVKDYLSVGKSYLEYDLMQLLTEVDSGGDLGTALDNFAKSVGMSIIRDLVVVIKGCLKSKNQQSLMNLEIIENRIIELDDSYKDAEIKKCQEKLKSINDFCTYCVFAVVFVPMLIYSYQGITAMMK